MKADHTPKSISPSIVYTLSSKYPHEIPKDLQTLEELRVHTIPETLAQRRTDGDAFLEKAEVINLVDWKLKHGTYRPALAKQVASNSVTFIRSITSSAYSTFTSSTKRPTKALNTLTSLTGIGPATASLLLSVYDPVRIPFFSDELFRWLHWEDVKEKGWDRRIKYNMKEYESLLERLENLRGRLKKENDGKEVSALDIENAAYVICKIARQSQAPKRDAKEAERDHAVMPPSPKRRKKSSGAPSRTNTGTEDPFPKKEKTPDPIEEVFRKGFHGSPTYDKLGFELDKEYVLKQARRRPRPLGKRAMEKIQRHQRDSERKREIFYGTTDKEVGEGLEWQWDDRVARDLGIGYHEVGMQEYEEWMKKGFKVEDGGKEFKNPSKEENERLMALMTGCALRKGSKHR